MLSRISLTALALVVLTFGLALNAQDPPGKVSAKKDVFDPAQIKEDLGIKEKILARQYQEFEQQLLRLKQRLERSGKQEERDRAVVLDRVLEYCKNQSISVKFEQMVDVLKSKELQNLPEVRDAVTRSKGISEDLQKVIEMLREDSRSKILREQVESMEKTLKDLRKVIQDQQSVQGQTEFGKTQKIELAKSQEAVTKDTAKIVQKLGELDGSNPKDAKSKGAPKSAGKNGDKAAKAKDDGEKQSGEGKEGKEGKEGAGKEGADKEGKEGSGKEGAGKEGSGKEGSAKEGKEGSGKEGTAKEGKEGSGKEGSAKEGKEGAGKEGSAKEGKEGSGKEGDPKNAKSGDPKSGDPKAGDPKSGDPKSAKSGSEGGKSKKGDAKSGESSQGQSQAKDSGGKESPPPSGQQAKGDKKGGGPQPPQQAKDAPPNGKKQVQDGQGHMEKAQAEIEKDKNDDASREQAKAIEKLKQAEKKLEDLLRQLREEELERLLANLENRCQKMLAMQIQVYEGTKGVHKTVEGLADKQPDRNAKQESLKLSDSEGEIVLEASKAIELLEAEGSAVAFPEVFQQVREDMKHVQRRLGITDVGVVTQQIESDIIDSLKEMIDALKKEQKKMADKKSNPSQPGSPPPNQDQKLLEKIAELKMIRSLQIRVNDRTKMYGKMYQGEQTVDPNIRRELHNISERQERIFEITNRMAKGDNR